MTTERIAELRRITKTVRNEHARMDLKTPAHAFVLVDEIDALLAECERPWTSELPTVSGWYWNTNVAMIAEPVILYVDREQDKVRGYGSPLSMWNEDLWSGPLTPPQQAGAQTP